MKKEGENEKHKHRLSPILCHARSSEQKTLRLKIAIAPMRFSLFLSFSFSLRLSFLPVTLTSTTKDNVYTVEKIAGKKIKRGKVYYYIKWEGYPESQNTWELVDDVFCKELIEDFENQLKSKQQGSSTDSTRRSSSPSLSVQTKSKQLTPEIPDLTITHTTTTTSLRTESPQKQTKRPRVDSGKKPTVAVAVRLLFF